VRAVIGTGTEVSAFFAAVERSAGPAPISAVGYGEPAGSDIARVHEFELACQALIALFASWSSAAAASSAHRDGRADGEQSPSSEGDRPSTPLAELELRRVEAIVQASTARILADIALLEQRVAPGGGRSAVVPAGTPRP
jgi:hypothetical protein